MSSDIGENLKMIKDFIEYLDSVLNELPEDAKTIVKNYREELSKIYEKASETRDPRLIVTCNSMIREIIGKLIYETITETSPPNVFAANIMRNLGYDVKWINMGDLDVPFDLMTIRNGVIYLVSVKYSENGVSNGFSNTWTGEIKYFCNRLGAEPLVMLICKSESGFGVVFMIPLIEDVTFHETRSFDLGELDNKLITFIQALKG